MGFFGTLGYFVYNGNARVEQLLDEKKADLRRVRGIEPATGSKAAAEDDE